MSGNAETLPQGGDPRHRQAARVVAGFLIAIAAITMPFSQVMMPASTWFMPSFGAMIVLTDGLTAGLLIIQSTLKGLYRVRHLGAAYLFSAIIVVPHLLAFPGVFAVAPLIGGTDTAIWLWCFWHGGFVVGVLRFLLVNDQDPARKNLPRLVSSVVLVAFVLTLVATQALPWLPTLLREGNFRRLTTLGIGPAILIVSLAAAVLVPVRMRCKDALSAWLWVAMVAATLDVTLTLFGGGRFTVGWYSARVLSLITGVTMLFSLLSHLMREAGRVAEMNVQLEQLLCTDVLTKVANRRAFDTALEAEWKRASRAKTPISLIMIDVDHFKRFNDRYGHPAGDECLQRVAGALRAALRRSSDMAARLGGEEFGLLLPTTDELGARRVAECVRSSVSRLVIPHEATGLGHVTISVGTATAHPFASVSNPGTLMSMADQALYKAKASGRNTVWNWTEPVEATNLTTLVS